jgi:hypothetical protein
LATTAAVFLQQPAVGIFGLRIFVEIAQHAVAGGGVEVEVVFLHILAVIALIAGKTEGAFLEDWIAAVPQGQRETQPLLLVANPAQTILIPAIGAGTGLVVVEMLPGFAVGAVVLPHRAPGPFRQIRPPQPPLLLAFVLAFQTQPFGIVEGNRGLHGSSPECGVASAKRSLMIDEP